MYDDTPKDQSYLTLTKLALDIAGCRLIDIPHLSLSTRGISVVMGPNGAGKSLLLRLLHGLEKPTSGEVAVQTSRRAQAIVLQKPVLLRRSVEANLRFVLKARKRPLAHSIDLLERVRLTDKSHLLARRLSGGEQQRLAIAQALALDPEVLLLDEPTASLDPSATRMIEQILQEIVAEGVRVVLVTHDAFQARRLAKDVVFLANGQVLEHAPAHQFFDRPETEAARAYLAGRLLP